MISATAVSQSAATATGAALVVGIRAARDGLQLAPVAPEVLPSDTAEAVSAALALVDAETKTDAVTRVAAVPGLGSATVLAVGMGAESDPLTPDAIRRAAGSAVRGAGQAPQLLLALGGGADGALAALEGALLGGYWFDAFRSTDQKRALAGVTVLVAPQDRPTDAAVHEAHVVAKAVHQARDWTNTPPGHLRPSSFAAAAQQHVEGLGLAVSVTAGEQLRAQGFGGISAVGQGSDDPPHLVRIAYRHPAAVRHLALVGKGITFDSGGLSLKPAKSMEWMKADMAGAAAVVAATAAIARLGLAVNVTAYAPLAENMPSGSAQRPGDIITMYGGKTVEVLNTDAEGRLVLGDALVRAGEDDPDVVVDIATLTGAQIVALGPRVAGVMSNSDGLRALVPTVAAEVGEAMWPMPLPEELRANLDSPVADLANVGGPHGGMLTAGLFLREFAPAAVPWAHLDIAGPSFNEGGPYGYTPKGGTGSGVRTLVQLARLLADGPLPGVKPLG